MATKYKLPKGVKEFNFKPGRAGGVAKYPWDEWFNGDLWLLEQSKGEKDELGGIKADTITEKRDYEQPTLYMPSKLKLAGRKKYKVVQVSRVDAEGKRLDDAVIIKARDMTPEEREEEDKLRVVEKKKLKAKKKAKAQSNGATHSQDESGWDSDDGSDEAE